MLDNNIFAVTSLQNFFFLSRCYFLFNLHRSGHADQDISSPLSSNLSHMLVDDEVPYQPAVKLQLESFDGEKAAACTSKKVASLLARLIF